MPANQWGDFYQNTGTSIVFPYGAPVPAIDSPDKRFDPNPAPASPAQIGGLQICWPSLSPLDGNGQWASIPNPTTYPAVIALAEADILTLQTQLSSNAIPLSQRNLALGAIAQLEQIISQLEAL